MKKILNHIDLEYTEKDLAYIDELISYINYFSNEIVNFFEIVDFGEKVSIKLFDDLKKFRNKCSERWKNNEVPLWLCGLSLYENGKCNIYSLCLEEYKKTKGHNDDSLVELKCLIMHEFVHACHQKYTNNNKLPIWISEGLATALSHQYDDKELSFDATLEQMINGGTNYKNYYTMFSYVLDNYGRDYILELLKNNEKLEKQTPILYKEVNLNFKHRVND